MTACRTIFFMINAVKYEYWCANVHAYPALSGDLQVPHTREITWTPAMDAPIPLPIWPVRVAADVIRITRMQLSKLTFAQVLCKTVTVSPFAKWPSCITRYVHYQTSQFQWVSIEYMKLGSFLHLSVPCFYMQSHDIRLLITYHITFLLFGLFCRSTIFPSMFLIHVQALHLRVVQLNGISIEIGAIYK